MRDSEGGKKNIKKKIQLFFKWRRPNKKNIEQISRKVDEGDQKKVKGTQTCP